MKETRQNDRCKKKKKKKNHYCEIIKIVTDPLFFLIYSNLIDYKRWKRYIFSSLSLFTNKAMKRVHSHAILQIRRKDKQILCLL